MDGIATTLRSALIATLGSVLLVAPAGAATRVPCAPHAGELGRSMGAAIWVQGGSLYGCAPAVRSRRPELRTAARPQIRLGRWTRGARAALSTVDVAWTERRGAADGSSVDRVWAYDLRRGRSWLQGATPVPPRTEATTADQTIDAIRVRGDLVAWVTSGGGLVARPRQTDTELQDFMGGEIIHPEAPGAGGLVPTFQLTGGLVLIGRWPSHIRAAASSLQISTGEVVAGDGPCFETESMEITVRPMRAKPRVGTTWIVDVDDLPPDCDRMKIRR